MSGPFIGHSAPSDMAFNWRHHHPYQQSQLPLPGAMPLFGYDVPPIQPQQQRAFDSYGPYHGHVLVPPFAPVMSSRHFQPMPMMPFHSPAYLAGVYPSALQHQHQPLLPSQPPSLPQRVDTLRQGYSPMEGVVYGDIYETAQPDSAAVDPRRGRWFGNYAGEAARPHEQQSELKLSRRAQTHSRPRGTADVDHPSYDRPPVRRHDSSSAVRPGASAITSPTVGAETPVHGVQDALPTLLPTAPGEPLLYDLIPNTSNVPPPPAIDLSAVPLADLATEMVWEACALGVETMVAAASDFAYKPASFLASSTGSTSPCRTKGTNTPELTFGAIGEERRARKVSGEHGSGWSSDYSSPSSSTPGTPDGVGALEAAVARRQKLAGLGFGYVGDGGKPFANLFVSEEDERRALDSPVAAIRTHARKVTNKAASTAATVASSTFPAEPSLAFRQFVKQILTATLLTPEDLILALYYVARIPSTAFIQSPSLDQANSASACASAIKSAPFKILLGALMLANKTLQDHNYRCDTWSTVSAIPLKDVNALEVYVFSALDFDVAVRDDTWLPWLTVVRERASARRGDIGDCFDVDQAILRVMRAARDQVLPPIPRPVTPPAPRVSTDALVALDLDAAGPLESPLKPRYSTSLRQRAAFPPLTRTYSQAVASELYVR